MMKQFRTYFQRRTSAMTLVELLVVIAIIVILIALLLPALGGAMSRANEVVCINNLKQFHMAMVLYSADNRVWPGRAETGENFGDSMWLVSTGGNGSIG